jgi:hypothetical protein
MAQLSEQGVHEAALGPWGKSNFAASQNVGAYFAKMRASWPWPDPATPASASVEKGQGSADVIMAPGVINPPFVWYIGAWQPGT